MKNLFFPLIILSLFCISSISHSHAQVVVSETSAVGDASSVLDVQSTVKGFLPPRMTTTQRNAISSPATGLTIYNTTTKCVEFFNGSMWYNICGDNPAGGATSMCMTFQIYDTVHAGGNVWHDRNLGAAQAPTATTDYLAYGALFQWGRLIDGHECINWASSSSGTPANGSTGTLSTTDDPGHGLFIANLSGSSDWRNPQNNNLWQAASGINNPCPSGYRVPTQTELQDLVNTFSSNDGAGAYASPVKFQEVGKRTYDGSMYYIGGFLYYWTSTVGGASANALSSYGGSLYMDIYPRGAAQTVRCLED